MPAKMRVAIRKYDDGRLDKLEIFKRLRQRKPLTVQYLYDANQILTELEFDGRREDLPSLPEIVDLVNESFIDWIGVIKNIKKIDEVYVKGIKGVETRVYRQFGSISKSTIITLCDLSLKDIDLQHLEFSTDYKDSTLQIYPYKADGTLDLPIRVMARDGTVVYSPTPSRVNVDKSRFFHELIYDETNNYYKFSIGYSIRFSHGLKIDLQNPDGVNAHNLACEVVVAISG